MRRPRRNHSPLFKAKVALAALEGSETLAQSADRFDLHAHQHRPVEEPARRPVRKPGHL
jgi:transposase-like protein